MKPGVACSGGGIRSAAYCIGGLEALTTNGQLPNRTFYLSTVSGGGYAGTAFVRQGAQQPPPVPIATVARDTANLMERKAIWQTVAVTKGAAGQMLPLTTRPMTSG